MNADEMLDPANDPANWDYCDEHETVFWKGDACPKCEPEPDYDPTPWCSGCGVRRQRDCHCGPIASND